MQETKSKSSSSVSLSFLLFVAVGWNLTFPTSCIWDLTQGSLTDTTEEGKEEKTFLGTEALQHWAQFWLS